MEYQEERIDGYLVSDICCYLDKNKEHYLNHFRDIISHRWTFNLCSAFLGQYWLCYRLMIIEAFGLMLLDSLVSSFAPLLLVAQMGYNKSMQFMNLLCFLFLGAIHIGLMGFFGDRLYWWHIKRGLNFYQCREKEKDTQTQAELKRMGGTSTMAVVICILVQGILMMLCKKIAFIVISGT